MARLLWLFVLAGMLLASGCKEEEPPRKDVKQSRKMMKPGGR